MFSSQSIKSITELHSPLETCSERSESRCNVQHFNKITNPPFFSQKRVTMETLFSIGIFVSDYKRCSCCPALNNKIDMRSWTDQAEKLHFRAHTNYTFSSFNETHFRFTFCALLLVSHRFFFLFCVWVKVCGFNRTFSVRAVEHTSGKLCSARFQKRFPTAFQINDANI